MSAILLHSKVPAEVIVLKDGNLLRELYCGVWLNETLQSTNKTNDSSVKEKVQRAAI